MDRLPPALVAAVLTLCCLTHPASGETPAMLGEHNVTAYVFWGVGCPHCRAEKRFLDGVGEKYPSLDVHYLEIYNNESNRDLFNRVMDAKNVGIRGVPTFLVGDVVLSGYRTDDTTGAEIESAIEQCLAFGCPDALSGATNGKKDLCVHLFIKSTCPHCRRTLPQVYALQKRYGFDVTVYDVDEENNREIYEDVKDYYLIQGSGFPIAFVGNRYLLGDAAIRENLEAEILAADQQTCSYPFERQRGLTSYIPQPGDLTLEKEWRVVLPVFGELDTREMSLPLFTAAIGLVDGFNPCAMWVLMFLLTILAYAKSRLRVLLVGGIFVATSALIYFLFMAAWLNVFLFIGYVQWLRIVIGVVALIAGLINVKDYVWFRKGVSLTLSDEKKDKIIARIRGLTRREAGPALVASTVVLAVFVNLFELACTFGFPAIYTRILTLRELPGSLYYAYLALYCLFYVVPLAVIVGFFAHTMGHAKLSPSVGRTLKLVGGLLMLALGLVLLFAPDLLVLG